jgi:hypothetical protein
MFGLAGLALTAIILWDAFETILVPRRIGRRVRLTRYFYLWTWRAWRAIAVTVRTTSAREGVLGVYGPLSLIGLLACWAAGLVLAFAWLQMAAALAGGLPAGRFVHMLYLSGETFFTLGFGDVTPATRFGGLLAVVEAGLGFGFLGTVVGYLPTMYAAFAQRELEISLMDARAGSPPTAAEFLGRIGTPGEPTLCDEQLRGWERWSAQLLETHISYPQLAYYRSQHVNQSWLATLLVVLDSSAVVLARTGDGSADQARLTFAMARHALVDITQIFVRRYVPGRPDRLGAAAMGQLRARLANTPNQLPATAEFEARLAELRLMYEPYAQALAAYLLFELPPWASAEPRRDNWRGGPWDRQIHARRESPGEREEHF